MLRRLLAACVCAALAFSPGCGVKPLTKAEMTKKVAGKSRKGELRSILGEPQEVEKLPGATEEANWFYNAADGKMKFHIYGDMFEVPGESEKKE